MPSAPRIILKLYHDRVATVKWAMTSRLESGQVRPGNSREMRRPWLEKERRARRPTPGLPARPRLADAAARSLGWEARSAACRLYQDRHQSPNHGPRPIGQIAASHRASVAKARSARAAREMEWRPRHGPGPSSAPSNSKSKQAARRTNASRWFGPDAARTTLLPPPFRS